MLSELKLQIYQQRHHLSQHLKTNRVKLNCFKHYKIDIFYILKLVAKTAFSLFSKHHLHNIFFSPVYFCFVLVVFAKMRIMRGYFELDRLGIISVTAGMGEHVSQLIDHIAEMSAESQLIAKCLQ